VTAGTDTDTCPSVGRHGTHIAYVCDGCRCPDGRRANARYAKVLRLEHLAGRRRLIDATGTARRLRALAAAGWPKHIIADQLDVATARVDMLLRQPTITRPTADRVAYLYRALSHRPGPSRQAAGHARRLQHVPPAGWAHADIDDPAATPWPMLLPDGSTEDTVRPCPRPGCHGYVPLDSDRRYCTDRCSAAARRTTWRENSRARRGQAAA
jgi:hypothetical protein